VGDSKYTDAENEFAEYVDYEGGWWGVWHHGVIANDIPASIREDWELFSDLMEQVRAVTDRMASRIGY
jgi:hypothetical protein